MKDAKVSEMIEEFLYTMKVVSDRDNSTIEAYKIALNEFNLYMFENEGKISDMAKLTSLDIMLNWFNVLKTQPKHRSKPLSISSLNQRLVALNMFYQFLIGLRFNIQQVTVGIPKFTDKNTKVKTTPKKKFLYMDETKNVIAEVEKKDSKLTEYEMKRNEMIMKLFLGCGLRIEELSLLTYNHISIDDEKIYITEDIAKYGKSRVVDIPTPVVDLYRDYLKMRKSHKNNSDYLFISRRNNKMHVNSIRDVVHKVSEKANGEKINPHGLRHTYGTQQIAGGQNPLYVSQQMGHANVSITTGIYVHQAIDSINRANNNPIFM